MKTNKNTMRDPQLFVDDHHGIYMGQLAWNKLAIRYVQQALKVLGDDDIKSLNDVEDEFHHETVDKLTRIQFKTPTGQKFTINFAEGGMWLIPNCFWKTKAAADWN